MNKLSTAGKWEDPEYDQKEARLASYFADAHYSYLENTMHLHLSAVMALLCLERIIFGVISGLLVQSGAFLQRSS